MTINKKAEITLVLDLDEFVALKEFIGKSSKDAMKAQDVFEGDIDTVYTMFDTMRSNTTEL